MPPAFFFFVKIALAIQALLWFHTTFRIVFSISMKNTILIGITLNLYIVLGSMDILTILILPVHEQGISFYLFVFSSVPFIRVL